MSDKKVYVNKANEIWDYLLTFEPFKSAMMQIDELEKEDFISDLAGLIEGDLEP